MPTWAERVLPIDRRACGAAFYLDAPPATTTSIEIESAHVVTEAGLAFLWVEFDRAVDGRRLLAAGFDAAQAALDVYWAKGHGARSLVDAHRRGLLWWNHETGTTARVREHTPFQQRVEMSWQQTRRGTVIASSEDDASPTPTPEFAYLRRAQITHDTFDAYRNVWLALESGLQRVLPKSGREKQWLQAALELTDKQFEGGFGQVWPDFVDRHYAAYRCALFHASRDGRRVPGSFADLRQVREALAELAQLTVQLVQRVLGWESHIALTLQQGWDHTVDVLGGLTIGVTDDDRDDDPSMTAPAQPGRLIDEVAPDHVRVVREPFERTFTGRPESRGHASPDRQRYVSTRG